jgi:type II secretory pathway pseudopilin PulG
MTSRRNRPAFTMVEMLVTVAGLIIVLGLMVSLARYVRERAAVALTKELLRQLDDLATQYRQRNGGQLPSVPAFPPTFPSQAQVPPRRGTEWDEANNPADRKALLGAALENNRRFVAVLKAESGSSAALNSLPLSMYNDVVLRDAWGSPIVFMPSKHPLVGTAPNNRYFFFSAGPDRLYLTQDDNLYSYEDLSLEQLGVVRR